jgi:hypothetical protein
LQRSLGGERGGDLNQSRRQIAISFKSDAHLSERLCKWSMTFIKH